MSYGITAAQHHDFSWSGLLRSAAVGAVTGALGGALGGAFSEGISALGGHVLLGYFFGPRRERVPALADLSSLSASGAELVRRFGYLGLADGTWPRLGRFEGWDRSAWPTPSIHPIWLACPKMVSSVLRQWS